MKKIYTLFLTLALTIAFAGNSFAQNTCESSAVQAYISSTQTGNQAYKGELGMEFTVNNSIIIKQLGAFDDGGNGINGEQGGGVRVAIFNRNTQAIVPGLDATVIGAADAYTGNHRMKNITPVTLTPGNYVIVAKGYHLGEQLGNSLNGGGPYPAGNTGGGAVTYETEIGFGPDDPTGFNYPATQADFGDAHLYLAATFTFTTTFSCALSNIANLSNLVISQGTLVPAFVQLTASYTASVPNSTASLTVTPTAADAGATIQVNGSNVTSGNASGQINLNVGSNIITIAITAQNGTTTNTYTVNVTRAAPTLPVVIVNFSAQLTADKKVAISWTTQQEINAANFDVEKSNDGIHWLSIASIKATGSSSRPVSYSAIDLSPSKGSNLYRIRMNDLDGKFEFTAIKNVRMGAVGKISLYPNPSTDAVNISLEEKPQSDWSVSIINNTGQIMLQKKFSRNISTISLPVKNFPNGNYTLEIADGNSRQSNKLMINHN